MEGASTKVAKQRHHRPPSSLANDEGGYEADGDERGTALAKPTALGGSHRPKFPRVDTKQRKRVVSLLANHPLGATSTANDPDVFPELQGDPMTAQKASRRRALPPSSSLRSNVGKYNALARAAPKAAPVGLGLGLPSNHPLRTRAFTMPLMSPASSVESRHAELLPSRPFPAPLLTSETQILCPGKLTLKPTMPEVSPPSFDLLPPSVVCYPSPDLAALPFGAEDSMAFTLAKLTAQEVLSPWSLHWTSYKDPAEIPPALMPVPNLAAPHLGENGATADEMLSEHFSACLSRVSGLF
ncbi:hypothetical protein BS17DRAFT_132882 [Gyrodon lividus]|nr:hypothetical protein BS17DRAFT_132882 [Gyrodon lividus]